MHYICWAELFFCPQLINPQIRELFMNVTSVFLNPEKVLTAPTDGWASPQQDHYLQFSNSLSEGKQSGQSAHRRCLWPPKGILPIRRCIWSSFLCSLSIYVYIAISFSYLPCLELHIIDSILFDKQYVPSIYS